MFMFIYGQLNTTGCRKVSKYRQPFTAVDGPAQRVQKPGRPQTNPIIAMHHGNVSPAIAKGLVALKARIAAAKIPSSKLDETLNLATWNIREFGKVRRTDAAIHYLAEIIGQFDLVGLVELRDDLTDLGRVLQILGPT